MGMKFVFKNNNKGEQQSLLQEEMLSIQHGQFTIGDNLRASLINQCYACLFFVFKGVY